MMRFHFFLTLALAPTMLAAADWPEWRGSSQMGYAAEGKYPKTWSETDGIVWKTELPGRGWSTPAVVGDRIWMTTAFEVKASEAEAKERLKTNTGGEPLTLLSELKLHALCVDRSTGKLLHNVHLLTLKHPQWVHRMNSYASPSPIVGGGRVFCHFGTFGNFCLDADTGKVLWRNTDLQVMHENGPGSSPALWKDKLILHYDGSDTQFIAALDVTTGKVAWQTSRTGKLRSHGQLKKAYATPLVIEHDGKPQVVSQAADWVYGYDPQTGKELWKTSYGTMGFSNVARPVYADDVVYIATGFMRSEIHALKLPVGGGKAEVLWKQTKSMPRMVSPIYADGLLYVVSDSGIATCLDAKTGEVKWRERLDAAFNGSPIKADGHLYICTRDGRTILLKLGAAFNKVGENKLDGEIYASPVAVDSTIFLRTDKALYRIGN